MNEFIDLDDKRITDKMIKRGLRKSIDAIFEKQKDMVWIQDKPLPVNVVSLPVNVVLDPEETYGHYENNEFVEIRFQDVKDLWNFVKQLEDGTLIRQEIFDLDSDIRDLVRENVSNSYWVIIIEDWCIENNYPINKDDWTPEQETLFNLTWR